MVQVLTAAGPNAGGLFACLVLPVVLPALVTGTRFTRSYRVPGLFFLIPRVFYLLDNQRVMKLPVISFQNCKPKFENNVLINIFVLC